VTISRLPTLFCDTCGEWIHPEHDRITAVQIRAWAKKRGWTSRRDEPGDIHAKVKDFCPAHS